MKKITEQVEDMLKNPSILSKNSGIVNKKNKKSIFKRAVNMALTSANIALASFSVLTSGVVAKEIYEELTSKNMLINLDYGFGNLIISHKENRDIKTFYEDIEKAILEVEGIEKAFDGTVLTEQEKAELINKVIFAINKEANIVTNGFTVQDFEKTKDRTVAVYRSLPSFPALRVNKDIYLSTWYYEESSVSEVLLTVIHEMMHAVEQENLIYSKGLNTFDKAVLSTRNMQDGYKSSFRELGVHMQTAKIMQSLEYKYSTNKNFTNKVTKELNPILEELVTNMYQDELNTKDIPHKIIREDANNYTHLTIGEIIQRGFRVKLDNAGIPYKNQNLTQSYYYKSIETALGEDFLNIRYVDFKNNNYAVEVDNIKQDISQFEERLAEIIVFKDRFIAQKVAEYTNIYRYSLDYSDSDKIAISSFILKYLKQVPDELKKNYGLNDSIQIIEEAISKMTSSTQQEDYKLEL